MEAPDFFIEDLLDLSNGGDDVITDAFFDSVAGNSTDSSTVTPGGGDTCNSFSAASRLSFPDHFSDDLCVPCDDLAELEWLSNFVEDSFSSEDIHKFHLIPMGQQPSGSAQFHNMARQPNPNTPSSVRGKARSKRSRVVPCDWSTRLLMVASTSSSNPNQSPGPTQKKSSSSKRRDNGVSADNPTGEVRRCLHCAAEKTPQWRTGPLGQKTLCNACGVRYKSGRLVPEYRPAASPTFVSTKHSNSHRKVVELRRQKEVQQQVMGHPHHHDQCLLMGAFNGGDDYLIHQHLSTDYRQMI